jgi:hypothetical protein
MYDFAKNGIPVIYAITSNGTEYKLIVATNEGYFKEYMTGVTDIGAVTSFAAAADGTVVFGVGTNYYTHDDDSYSSWANIPAPGSPGTINGICGDRHNIYAQVSDLGLEYIYGLDSGSKTWYQMGQITTAGVFAGFFYSKSDKAVYHYRITASTNLYFYRISGGQAILESSPATSFTTIPHCMKYRSFYYAADTTSYLRAYDSSGQVFATPAPIASPDFAVVDSGTIFAGNASSPNVYLSRLNMTTLSWDTPIVTKNLGAGAVIKVKVCDSRTLALGMNSSVDGGLYTFNTGTNELKQITPMKIQHLDVK